MKKMLLKLSMATALTMGFAMLTPVAAQAQTSLQATTTNPPGVPEDYVIVSGSGTQADPYVFAEEGTSGIRMPDWGDPDDGYGYRPIWHAQGNSKFWYLMI